MRYLSLAIAPLCASCAATWLAPIREVGLNTYQITHEMGTFSPVKGVRQGIIDRATKKCESEGATYAKVREEMTPARTLGYTLTFTCNPMQPSKYQ